MKKEMKDLLLELEQEELKQEKTTIDIDIKNEDDILSSFSSDEPVISNDLADYIESKINRTNIKRGLELNIICDDIDENEEIIYRDAIKNYYKLEFISANKTLKSNNIFATILMFIGIIILGICITVQYIYEKQIWAEVVDIMAWVFIWEGVHIMFIERVPLVFTRLKSFELMKSKINFKKKSDK